MFYSWSVVWSRFGGINLLDYAISGLLLGTIGMPSGSLLPAIIMHAVTNPMEWVYFQVG